MLHFITPEPECKPASCQWRLAAAWIWGVVVLYFHSMSAKTLVDTTNKTSLQQPPRLRPMGVADLLDAAVQLYRKNFIKLITIAAVVIVPVSILDALTRMLIVLPLSSPEQYLNQDSSVILLAGQGLNLLVSLVGTAALYTLMIPALVWASGRSYMGQSSGIWAAYKTALRRWPLMAVVVFLYLAAIAGLSIAWIVPCIGWLGAPALMLFVSVNMLTLLPAVLTLENGSLINSIKRGWVLAKHIFWRAAWFMLAAYFFSTAVTSGPSAIAMIIFLLLADNMALGTAINAGLGALMAVLYIPIVGAGLALLYYDARVRLEAFDLELMAKTEPQPETYSRHVPWVANKDWPTLLILVGVCLAPIVLCTLAFLLMAGLGAFLEATGG